MSKSNNIKYSIVGVGVVSLLAGYAIAPKGISEEDFNNVNEELEISKNQITELNKEIENLNSDISDLKNKEEEAKVWLNLDEDSKERVEVEIEKIEEEKRLEEQRKIEEEKRKAEEAKKLEEQKKKEEEIKEQKLEESNKVSSSTNGSSNNNDEESGKHIGKKVYTASGNRYYHAISNCKYLEGASTSLVTLSADMDKFECNCFVNPVPYKKPSSSNNSSSNNSSSSGSSSSSNGKTVYIASGNSYYHNSPSCKFLDGASTSAVDINNVGGKHACNCVKY